MTNDREARGMMIAATCKITRKGGAWIVPSQTGVGKYTVVLDETNPHCSCPDHETRACKCKHIFAAEFTWKREQGEDGTVTETRTLTLTESRKTYPQNWPAYNRAQVNEKAQFQVLLRDLCAGIQQPEQNRPGRPSFPIRDAIFSACFKVFSTLSGRRFMSDLADAKAKGYIGRAPSYNMIFKVFEQEETSGILKALVEESAVPLKAIESTFAVDSSGFSGCRFDRWFEEKWGKPVQERRAWVKAHIMCGVKTNVITAVEVMEAFSGDSTQFPGLLATTTSRFNVKQVCADMAYSSKGNLALIDAAKAEPLIPFKSNSTGAGGGLWEKFFLYFSLNREEFLAKYHARSNVESTFSMVKAKFGDGCRSKCDVAMRNEVLAKLVCHNICCLIQAMYELGITPSFWAEVADAHKLAAS